MPFLQLENVSKSFGSFKALNDISFTAEAGDFVVLLGPSGCGKSTLLRLITGLTEDHEGEIYINGRNVTDLDPKDRRVAMVFQSYALYPHLSVARNISFGSSSIRTSASGVTLAPSTITPVVEMLRIRTVRRA